MNQPRPDPKTAPRDPGPYAALDPGRCKCGLVRSDPAGTEILAAGVLDPERCWQLLEQWQRQGLIGGLLLGDGTGSGPWQPRLAALGLPVLLVEEAGTTLAARERYWQLEPARGWRRLLPHGLRLPPRDVDDVVAQLLLERHLGQPLGRRHCTWLEPLRTSPAR
ncbi:MAG: resolvase [Vulcanococcus sp.]